MSVQPRTGASNFSLTAPMVAVRESTNQPTLALQQKCEKPWTLPLRIHDLRHHAITELCESQVSEQTIMAIAGHVSKEMLCHYSHVRQDAMRRALDALAGGTFEGG